MRGNRPNQQPEEKPHRTQAGKPPAPKRDSRGMGREGLSESPLPDHTHAISGHGKDFKSYKIKKLFDII